MCNVLSAKDCMPKDMKPGRISVGYKIKAPTEGPCETRGLRKMGDVLRAEDCTNRHHPWQTPYRLQNQGSSNTRGLRKM